MGLLQEKEKNIVERRLGKYLTVLWKRFAGEAEELSEKIISKEGAEIKSQESQELDKLRQELKKVL